MKLSINVSGQSKLTNRSTQLTDQANNGSKRTEPFAIEEQDDDDNNKNNNTFNRTEDNQNDDKSEDEYYAGEEVREEEALSNVSGQQKMLLKYNFTDGEKNFISGGSSTNKNTLSKLNKKKKGIQSVSAFFFQNNLCYCPTLGILISQYVVRHSGSGPCYWFGDLSLRIISKYRN